MVDSGAEESSSVKKSSPSTREVEQRDEGVTEPRPCGWKNGEAWFTALMKETSPSTMCYRETSCFLCTGAQQQSRGFSS